MSEQVHLPSWVEPMAHQHAESFCVHYFDGKDVDEKNFRAVYEKAFHQFCLEFYKHSLIPGVDGDGEMNDDDIEAVEEFIFASNPGQVVSRAAFEGSQPRDKAGHRIPGAPAKPHFMRDFFIEFFKSTQNPQHEYDEIKDATNRAVERYLEGQLPQLNLDHGGKSNKLASKQKLKALPKEERKKFYREAVIARYVRLFMAAYSITMLKKVFETKGSDIVSFVDKLLKQTELRDLQTAEYTDRFALSIEKAIAETLSKIDLASVAASVLDRQDWKSIPKPKMSEETKKELRADAERKRREKKLAAEKEKAADTEPAAKEKSVKTIKTKPRR
jgi:hypothetical protein